MIASIQISIAFVICLISLFPVSACEGAAGALKASPAARKRLDLLPAESVRVDPDKRDDPDYENFIATIGGKTVYIRISKVHSIIDHLTPSDWQETKKKFVEGTFKKWEDFDARGKMLMFALDRNHVFEDLFVRTSRTSKSEGTLEPVEVFKGLKNSVRMGVMSDFKLINEHFPGTELEDKVKELEDKVKELEDATLAGMAASPSSAGSDEGHSAVSAAAEGFSAEH